MRRTTVLAMTLLGAAGCSYDASALGSSEESTRGESTTHASGEVTSSSTPTDGVDGGTTLGGLTSGSSSTGSSSSGTDASTGPELPALVDEGLLARWYVDEASQGTEPDVLVDHQAPGLDLPIVYSGDEPAFEVLEGSRGLEWDAIARDGRAVVDIASTKLDSELTDATRATFEVVVDVDEVTTDYSRFMHFGHGGDGGNFAIGSSFLDRLLLRWNGSTLRSFEADFGQGRCVVHVVVDTDASAPEDRLRAWIDGVELVVVDAGVPDQGMGLPLAANAAFALGNRSDGQRSFRGHLQYAAIYTEVLDQAQIENNVAVLLASDDAP